jgi:translation initiation factor eIF-2B subunit delta
MANPVAPSISATTVTSAGSTSNGRKGSIRTLSSATGSGVSLMGPSSNRRKQSISIEPLHSQSLELEVSTSSLMNRIRDHQAYIHPKILRLALRFGRRHLLGSTDRCLEMLRTFRMVIEDYQAPMNVVIGRHLDAWIRPQIAYLVAARQLAVPMGHAIRFLKLKISELSPDVNEEEAKKILIEAIDSFVRNRFILPKDYIVATGLQKIKPNDVIITFAR